MTVGVYTDPFCQPFWSNSVDHHSDCVSVGAGYKWVSYGKSDLKLNKKHTLSNNHVADIRYSWSLSLERKECFIVNQFSTSTGVSPIIIETIFYCHWRTPDSDERSLQSITRSNERVHTLQIPSLRNAKNSQHAWKPSQGCLQIKNPRCRCFFSHNVNNKKTQPFATKT